MILHSTEIGKYCCRNFNWIIKKFPTTDLIPVVLHQFLEVEEKVFKKRGTLPFKEVFG